MKLPNNLKYKELREWYQQQPEPKAIRQNFRARVILYGYDKQSALDHTDGVRKAKRCKHIVYDDNGRVCNKCKQYKKRDEYSYNKVGFMTRNSICKVCKNKDHAEYRLNGGYEKDHEYKQRKRKLNIGDQVYFNSKIREVIDYKNKKGYGVQCIVPGEKRRIDTADNKLSLTHNAVRFRKLEEKVILENTNTPEITLEDIPKEKEKKFSIDLDEMLYGDYE